MRARLFSLLKRPTVVNGAIAMMLRGATLASRFLLSILLARMLSPSDMGAYGLISAILAFGLFVLGLEFYSYTLREMVPASPGKRVQIITDQIFLASSFFGIISIGAVIAAFVGMLSKTLLFWILLILATEHVSLEVTRILVITSRIVQAYIVGFLRGGIWVYGISILMLLEPSARSLEMVLIWWAGGGILAAGYAALCLSNLPWRELRNYRPDLGWILVGLRTARPFMLTAASALMLSYVDRFFIDGFVGRDGLGIYTFYSTVLIGILSLGASISQQFLPRVIAGYIDGPESYRLVVRWLCVSMLAAASGLAAVAGIGISPLLSFFDMRAYSENVGVFYLMLPGIFLRMLADAPSYALYAAHSDRALLACNLGAAIVSVCANFALVPTFGLAGAALSGGLASATLFISLTILAWNQLRGYHTVHSSSNSTNNDAHQ